MTSPSAFSVDAAGPSVTLAHDRYRLADPAAILDDAGFASVFEQARDAGAARFTWRGGDDVLTGALLRVAAPWLVLEREGQRLGVAAASKDHIHYLGVFPTSFPFIYDRGPEVEVELAHLEAAQVPGSFSGEGWTLRAHPLCAHAARDWVWAWNRGSLGPIDLFLYLQKTRAELEAWLASHAPLPYARAAGAEFLSASADDRAPRIYLADGRAVFTRSRHEPEPWVSAVDAGLCRALAGEALLAWDLVEEDYGTHLATGDDGASLVRYLDPASDERELRQSWRSALAERTLDLRGLGAPDAIARAFATEVGLGMLQSAAEVVTAFAAMPLDARPRVFVVKLEQPVYERSEVKAFLDALAAGRPRARWTFRFGP